MNIELYDNEYYWVKYDPEIEIEIAQYKSDNFYFCGYDAPVHKDKVNVIDYVLNPWSGYHDVDEYYKDTDI